MSNMHLLTCKCGQELPVSPSQAGERVVCGCGAPLEVPPLRRLKELPKAPDSAGPQAAEWGVKQGVLTLGLVVSAALAAIGGYWWKTEPPMPRKATPAELSQQIDTLHGQLTPVQAYEIWAKVYVPLKQMREWDNAQTQVVQAQIARHKAFRWGFLGAAGVVLLLSFAASAAMQPSRAA